MNRKIEKYRKCYKYMKVIVQNNTKQVIWERNCMNFVSNIKIIISIDCTNILILHLEESTIFWTNGLYTNSIVLFNSSQFKILISKKFRVRIRSKKLCSKLELPISLMNKIWTSFPTTAINKTYFWPLRFV